MLGLSKEKAPPLKRRTLFNNPPAKMFGFNTKKTTFQLGFQRSLAYLESKKPFKSLLKMACRKFLFKILAVLLKLHSTSRDYLSDLTQKELTNCAKKSSSALTVNKNPHVWQTTSRCQSNANFSSKKFVCYLRLTYDCLSHT